MTYRVELEARPRAELLKLDKPTTRRIVEVIDALQSDPRPPGAKKLTGLDGYRVRKGAYRVLYTIDDEKRLVRVYRIGHRSDVYRR